MEKIFLISLSFSVIIFTFRHTNFVIEYYNLFNLRGLKWLDDYNEMNRHGYVCGFHEYLIRNKHGSFFGRLVTCPVCLSVWCGILSIALVGWRFLAVSYLTLLFHYFLQKMKV